LNSHQKARALTLLAREMNPARARALEPQLPPEQWRLIFQEAAALFLKSAQSRPDSPQTSSARRPNPAQALPPAPPSGGRPVLFIDGASRGNPGPAAAGGVIYLGQERLAEFSEKLGIKTNNQAEYEALLRGLALLRELGFEEVEIRSDSQLVVRQIKGQYRVKEAKLKPLFNQAQEALKELKQHDIVHIDRQLNQEADGLANRALDRDRL